MNHAWTYDFIEDRTEDSKEMKFLKTKVLAEKRRLEYNHYRLHGGLDYMMPAAFAATCIAEAKTISSSRQYAKGNVDNSLIACGT